MDVIGRDHDLEQVEALLGRHRLVTLVGPGGIGKTTLASELGRRTARSFDGGVFVAELSGLDDVDDIVPSVSRQLGFESLEAARLRAAGLPTLVVLDNCESAVGQAATVARSLIDPTSEITVLATSRVPLHVAGERVVGVGGLDLPDLDHPESVGEAAAALLFVDRASAVGATWTLTAPTLVAIAQLVRRFDGLPLAIELAAARSRVLPPQELVRLLDQQLDLLARPGDEHDRHRSLRSAIVGSYEPLPSDRQRFLRQLSVFDSPFDLTLAHRVAGSSPVEIDTIDAITDLVDASLIAVRPHASGGVEYRLLDSIRAFARERLDEAGETLDAHDRYVDAMVAFADEIVAEALEAFTPEVLGRIREQFVHLSNTIAWCLDHDATADRAYRLFVPLYGPTGGRVEVADLARRMEARWKEPAPLRAEARAVMALAIFLSGTTDEAVELARQAIDDPDGSALAKMIGYRVLGFVAAVEDRIDDAREALGRGVDLAEPVSEAFARELRISQAGLCTNDPVAHAAAIEVLEEASAAAMRRDEKVNVAWAAIALAFHHGRLGDVASARREAEAGMRIAARTGFPWSRGSSHRSLATVLALDEGWAAAASHFRASLDVNISIGDVEGAAIALRAAAAAAWRCGDRELAEALWATVPPLRARSVIRLILFDVEEELVRELGPPRAVDLAGSLVEARRLLGPPAGEGTPTSAIDVPVVATPADAATVIRFGDYELDLALHELRHGGERVHVEPQVFDVLAYLADNRGKMVPKEELLDEVWGDRFVSESALSSRIKAARQATGDDGRRQAVIRTIHGKGFTFVAPVTSPP